MPRCSCLPMDAPQKFPANDSDFVKPTQRATQSLARAARHGCARTVRGRERGWIVRSAPFLLLPALLTGCRNPLKQEAEGQLRESVLNYQTRELSKTPSRSVTLTRPPSALREQLADRIPTLEQMAGPTLHNAESPDLGIDLTGDAIQSQAINLEDAIQFAVKNNLRAQIAGITPAVSETDVITAEARFDALFFTNVNWTKTDERQQIVRSGFTSSNPFNASETDAYETGLRKSLISGATLSVSTSVTRTDNQTPNTRAAPDPAYESAVEVALEQPLLRGFGSQVNMAEVRLNRNANRADIQDYKKQLLQVVRETETAYWNLYVARYAYQVQTKLLERGVETRDILKARANFDVSPAELADAISRVETRGVSVERARTQILTSSDQLKQLVNDPGVPVASEIAFLPLEKPVDQAIVFNLVDCVIMAIQNRPEVQQAILQIDDASIRQMLAANLRLPRLNVSGRVRWNGLSDQPYDAYKVAEDQNFINFVLQMAFEVPLGNREAQARYQRARMQRVQAVLTYEQAVQNVTREVKEALRAVDLNYKLLERTRDARLAAAENLRTLEVREETNAQLSPEFLNVKFSRQESLAQAELEEVRALAEYQTSLADLYFAMGTGLEHNGIRFVVPDVRP